MARFLRLTKLYYLKKELRKTNPTYLSTTMRKLLLVLFIVCHTVMAQDLLKGTREVIKEIERFDLKNQDDKAIQLLENALKNPANTTDDLILLKSHLSGKYFEIDSLKLGSQLVDEVMELSKNTQSPVSKALAYRARAYMNSVLNLSDLVIKDSKEGLKLLENVEGEDRMKYFLNYLIYAVYSGWNESDKMEEYINLCKRYAVQSGDPNLIANVHLGQASVYINRYRKEKQKADLDSNYKHLQAAYKLFQEHPEQVSSNTFVVVSVNLANNLLEFSTAPLEERRVQAYRYLDAAEVELKNNRARFSRWINIYGIRSEFAMKQGNLALAEQYLIEAVSRVQGRRDNSLLKLEYTVYKALVSLSEKKGDLQSALNYQKTAEKILSDNFNQQMIMSAQKLDIQYEIEKKDEQLKLLTETASLRQRQNYLYGGLAILAILGLAFMFRSYHFKLRYSIEREKKLAKDKEDAQRQAEMQMQLEKEEQARLKAEQDLLELKHQQLQKEALANSLIIEHKNDMLKQIKTKLQDGDPRDVQKLLREETMLNADFEDIKWQIQQLHPTFFQQLIEKATQKLTPLDLRYCAYIYLQMSTKQIAQVLHVEAQSVRMFKYRLKQKFGLPKESDLETFLQEVGV